MMFGSEALAFLLRRHGFQTVLDVGSGPEAHAKVFQSAGKRVTKIDYGRHGKTYEETTFREPFDCLWACHVLEHMPNVGLALEKMRRDLKPGGVLAVTVPPAKDEIVGGHVSLWNAGLLLYRLILAGFDCSQASVKTYGYNISVVVQRLDAELPVLAHDAGDIERLARFFPMPVAQGFDGRIQSVNW